MLARFGSGVWAGSFVWLCVCVPLEESGQLHLRSTWYGSSSRSNNLQNRLICSSRPRKMETWNNFNFKFDLTFWAVCIYDTICIILCVGWWKKQYIPHCPSQSTISGCNTRRDGYWEGRWASAADGNQAVLLISPSRGISPKSEGTCCREWLQSHVAAELRRAGAGISWDRVTLHYTSTRFLGGLSNSLCVTLRPLFKLVHRFHLWCSVVALDPEETILGPYYKKYDLEIRINWLQF